MIGVYTTHPLTNALAGCGNLPHSDLACSALEFIPTKKAVLIGQGRGAKAGTAYRLKDGSMIYVPEEKPWPCSILQFQRPARSLCFGCL